VSICHSHKAKAATDRELAPVGRESDRADVTANADDGADELSAREIPQPDRLVLTAGGKQAAVRGNCELHDICAVRRLLSDGRWRLRLRRLNCLRLVNGARDPESESGAAIIDRLG
jgi:hypothetical protein